MLKKKKKKKKKTHYNKLGSLLIFKQKKISQTELLGCV